MKGREWRNLCFHYAQDAVLKSIDHEDVLGQTFPWPKSSIPKENAKHQFQNLCKLAVRSGIHHCTPALDRKIKIITNQITIY